MSELDRSKLPIPDRTPGPRPRREGSGATFPPIEPLRPPAGAPNVLVVLHRRRRLRAPRARSAGRAQHADRRAAGGERAEVQPLPHHRALLADAAGAADRAQPPLRRAWAASPRSPPRRPATARSARTRAAPLAETLKLNGYSTAQFGKCHEVPVWETSPMGPFDAWPTGSGFEHFYGFIGGETNQYAPAIYQRHGADRARAHGRGGLPLHRGHDRSRDRLGPPAEGADARQAVLRLLRARRDARAASRAAGVVGPVQGRVRRRLGRAARADRSRGRRSWASIPAGRRAAPPGRPRSPPGTTCPTT